MKLRYNAPVVLTFSLAAALVFFLNEATGRLLVPSYFSAGPTDLLHPLGYMRLFTHVLGHADLTHLVANFSFILIVGPLLEEKYGSSALLITVAVTAASIGVLNALLFSTGLLGASGIVFMMILLSSFTNMRRGEVPLTLVLVIILFLGREVIQAMGKDNVSQFAHILGGTCGAIFGFCFAREK